MERKKIELEVEMINRDDISFNYSNFEAFYSDFKDNYLEDKDKITEVNLRVRKFVSDDYDYEDSYDDYVDTEVFYNELEEEEFFNIYNIKNNKTFKDIEDLSLTANILNINSDDFSEEQIKEITSILNNFPNMDVFGSVEYALLKLYKMSNEKYLIIFNGYLYNISEETYNKIEQII